MPEESGYRRSITRRKELLFEDEDDDEDEYDLFGQASIV
jgi:hypothetical protein